MLNGKFASIEELNSAGIQGLDHTTYNNDMSAVLKNVMGEVNTPMANFQAYYNQIVSGT
jgi:hypothetical protein